MSPISYAVLRRYLTGQCDPAEQRMVERWAAESPSNRTYLDALGREWQRIEGTSSAADRTAADQAWRALAERLSPPPQPSLLEIEPPPERKARFPAGAFTSRNRWAMVPAAAAAVALLVTGIRLLDRSPDSMEQPPRLREVATEAGQQAEVTLGDGSTVTLGPKSRLWYPPDFGVHRRELTLEGQAYFRAVHDSTRPFTVRAGASRTVDLGTAFVVRAYAADELVQVVVTEGRVAFGADHPGAHTPAVLGAARMGRLGKEDSIPLVQTVDPARYTDWIHGRISFDNAPLREVANELGRWYDVDIRLADTTLASETLTATFDHSDSLPEVLTTLTTVLELDLEKRGALMLLHRRRR
jgi:transmembrane sensor